MQRTKGISGKKIWEFQLGEISDLKRLGRKLNVPVDAMEDVEILAEPVQVGEFVIPNSLAVHPMEGADGDSQGRPGRLTFRRYERFAAGGAGLIWVEATAIVAEGRANPRQLWLNEKSKEALAALVKHIRQSAKSNGLKQEPIIVLQLTHSGRYSKPEGVMHPLIVQRAPYRDAFVPQQKPDSGAESKLPDDWPILTDKYLDGLVDAYVNAARLAFQAGFDGVDIKSCHGYLINELFSSRQREGKYGGTFENRTRFLLDVIDRIHTELGEDKMVVSRLGIYDAIPYPYGWGVERNDYTKPDLTEPKRLIALLEQRSVKMINITAANPYYNPHYGRPLNEPIVGGYESPEHPLVGVSRLISLAGEIQKQFGDIAIVGTGYSWLRTLMANVAAASKANGLATLIGVGRMAFAYPDFARDIVNKGRLEPDKVCVCCSGCTQIMRDGGMIGCVVRDNKVYGPIYEQGRLNDRDNLVRLASACLQCQEPTCKLACPAGIDIPKFIRLFMDGRDKEAYEVIRQANIFAEVCAWLCPVEQQCEGSCLQKFIGDGSLPIATIQRYLAKQANKNGWSKLRIPEQISGKRVAVIGAGPAGLGCAAKLIEAGHCVTIFDKGTEFGGMVESVIPPDREGNSLDNEVAAIFKEVPAERMTLRLGEGVNVDFNLDSIMKEGFDAVFIGMGLPESVSITKGVICEGLWKALDFLSAARAQCKLQESRFAESCKTGSLNVTGKQVAVIGGGNTAMDAATTAKNLGAKDVYVIYRRSFKEMPAWGTECDLALNKGVHFLILTQLLDINYRDGKLIGIRVCPTRLGKADSSGRRSPVPVMENAYNLDMDVIIEAVGQEAIGELDKILPGVEIGDGLIRTEKDSFKTSRLGVFAGGDIIRGPATVVAAVADGMAAAGQIDNFLKQ